MVAERSHDVGCHRQMGKESLGRMPWHGSVPGCPSLGGCGAHGAMTVRGQSGCEWRSWSHLQKTPQGSFRRAACGVPRQVRSLLCEVKSRLDKRMPA